jgi:hypothetical protein
MSGSFFRPTVGFVLAASAAMAASLSLATPSFGAPIFMPLGSNVWMKWESNGCPFADGGDCVGSTQPGLAPPNGIPLTTIVDGTGRSTTGFAEILPDQVRTFVSGNTATSIHASFFDTYTVQGSAPGSFDITFELHVTGTARTVPTPVGERLVASNVRAEIGTFNPVSDVGGGTPLAEQFRVEPFTPANEASVSFATVTSAVPLAFPIDITATYTRTGVQVGDIFDIAYGVNSASGGAAEIDLLSTGAIVIHLPEGVFLTSVLNVPEPSGVLSIAVGLCALAVVGASRQRRARPQPA